ncbi:MAG: hypothetical protein LW630_11335, partial [Saprospiraceae bacterium]|nr:hypothetical protein [Saprospiraceae bacterium]
MRKGILFVLHVCISFLAVVTGYSQPMQRLSNSSPVLSSNGKVAAKSPQDSAAPMSGFDASPNTFVANRGQILL